MTPGSIAPWHFGQAVLFSAIGCFLSDVHSHTVAHFGRRYNSSRTPWLVQFHRRVASAHARPTGAAHRSRSEVIVRWTCANEGAGNSQHRVPHRGNPPDTKSRAAASAPARPHPV